MTYRLNKLAAGSYDVILDGVIIAGVVRSTIRDRVKWTAEQVGSWTGGSGPFVGRTFCLETC